MRISKAEMVRVAWRAGAIFWMAAATGFGAVPGSSSDDDVARKCEEHIAVLAARDPAQLVLVLRDLQLRVSQLPSERPEFVPEAVWNRLTAPDRNRFLTLMRSSHDSFSRWNLDITLGGTVRSVTAHVEAYDIVGADLLVVLAITGMDGIKSINVEHIRIRE